MPSALVRTMTVIMLMVVVGAAVYALKPDSTRTLSETVTTTATHTESGTVTVTQTQVFSSIATRTLTDTASTTITQTTTATSLTTTTLTRTLGTGVFISDYLVFRTNQPPDSVLKLNLTLTLVPSGLTYLTEVANVILTPSGGNAADIKFIPDPIITQASDVMTLSMYAILDHQIVAGTYIIEYSVSAMQGSAVAYTVLEVMR